MEGKVKWFDPAKGYGFLALEDGSDLFVHVSDLGGGPALQGGERVTFEIGTDRKDRKKAVNVQRVAEA